MISDTETTSGESLAAEAERLAALQSYAILDTLPEERFDRLTRLVSRELNVPISAVSLVDSHRQWFKSAVGLDATETPRDIAFCDHAIRSDDVLVVEDATLDTRFLCNPLVTCAPNIRFYAGAPLTTEAGFRLGTLCAIDSQPRKLSERERLLLQDLASIAVDELELGISHARQREHAEEMIELNERVLRANEQLKQFAFVASHDLQEPIRMVSAYSALIMDRYADRLDDDGNEFLGFVRDGADRMSQLVEDLLRYARATSRSGKPAPTETAAVFDQALHNLALAIQESGAKITREDLPIVKADPTLVSQLFTNLLANAIKFSGDSAPRVHVTAQAQGDSWRFEFRDWGIGVPADKAQRIFEPFQRLHSRKEYEGTGLGLSVCQSIVAAHGGSIEVTAAPERGSVFAFTLPANTTSALPHPDDRPLSSHDSDGG